MTESAFPKRITNSPLLFIVAAAVLVRILYLIIYASMPDWSYLTVDNFYHLNWAHDIASGNIFGDTTYFRAPFYIYCLAVLDFLFGQSLWVFRIFGMLVGIGSVVLTYLIAEKLFNRKVAVLASMIHLLYPFVLYFESEILLDALFIFLIELTVYRFLIWRESNSKLNLFWIGASLGIAAITRPTALIFVPVLIVLMMFSIEPLKKRVLNTTMILISAAFFILPVTTRNNIVGGEPVLIAAQGGVNFYIGNNSESDGLSASMPAPLGHNWQIRDITYIAEKEKGHNLKPGEVSSYWFDKTFDNISTRPFETFVLYCKKLYFNLSNREISNNRNLYDFIGRHALLNYNPLFFAVIFALAVIAILTGWQSHFGVRLLAVVILIFIFSTALFFFNSRFRLPALPLYFMLAAAGIESLIFRLKTSKKSIASPVIIGAAAFLFSILPVVSLPQGVTTQHILSNGLRLYHENKITEALRTFKLAVSIDSTFPQTNLNIGACFLKMVNIDSAKYYFGIERRLHPKRAESHSNLAAISLLEQNYKEALIESNRAIELKPYDPRLHLIKLRAASNLPDIESSQIYRLAMESAGFTDSSAAVLNLAAIVLTNRGSNEQAKQLLAIAVNSKPTPIEINDNAFSFDFDQGQHKFFNEIARAHYQLGFIEGIEGNFSESVRQSRMAIKIDTTLAEAYINLANGFRSLGDFAKTDSVMNEVLKRFPDHEIFQQQ